jgi:hypothetical protein
MTTATATAQALKVGQILHGSFGYSMTLNEFYVIERVSAASAWIREVPSCVVNDDGMGGGKASPDPLLEPFGPLTRHKIQTAYTDGEQWLSHKRLGSLRLWDGRPQYHNTYD